MKKIFLFAAAVAVSLSMSAQKQMHVWVNGVEIKYAISEVDSVTFTDSPIDENQNKDNEIGVFSVAADKQVSFSKGNLQYTQSTNTWSFAENQYDCLGEANVADSILADRIDLFGWSANRATAPFGVGSYIDYENNYHYSGSFVDWGTNQIGADAPNTWRTLSYWEWKYLLNTRPNASSLHGVAQVNGVNGFILLPDSWTCPEGVNFKSGFPSRDGQNNYAAYQTFTTEQWSKLEIAGAVFLPASGYRNKGSNMRSVQIYGYYWSATEYNSFNAYYLCFLSAEAEVRNYYRYGGLSVRLVKDL